MYVINFITYLLTPHQSNQVNSILLLLKFQYYYYYCNFLHSISATQPLCSAAIILRSLPQTWYQDLITLSSRDFSSLSKWGPVHPDPKKRRWPGLKNNFSWPCRLQFGLKIRWKLWPLSEIHHAIPDGELCNVQSSDQFPINNDNPSGQTKDSDFYTLPWIKLLERPAAQTIQLQLVSSRRKYYEPSHQLIQP